MPVNTQVVEQPDLKLDRASSKDNNLVVILIWLAAYLLSALFSFSAFTIDFWSILPPECAYIASGRFLLHHNIPPCTDGPLIAFFYLALYLPVHHSLIWLVQEARIGHFLIFSLIWLAGYRLISRLIPGYPSLLGAALLLSFPTFYSDPQYGMLTDSSAAMYTALSGFALSFLVEYVKDRRKITLLWASGFVGLAALTRADGLVVELTLVALVCVIDRFTTLQRSNKAALPTPLQLAALTAPALVPFVVIFFGYLIVSVAVTGHLHWQAKQTTYAAFEQGEAMAQLDPFEPPSTDVATLGNQIAYRKYGSPQTNNWSIRRAIVHNPVGYLIRTLNTIAHLPLLLLAIAFYNYISPGYSFLVVTAIILGIFTLVRQKEPMLLLVLLVWHIHLLIYFTTVFMPDTFFMALLTTVGLAAIGLKGLFDHYDSRDERGHRRSSKVVPLKSDVYYKMDTRLFAITAGLFGVLAVAFNMPGDIAAIAFYATTLAVPIYRLKHHRNKNFPALGSSIQAAIIVVIALATQFPFKGLPKPSKYVSDEEQAAIFTEHVARNGTVATDSARDAFMSTNYFDDIGQFMPALTSVDDVHTWIKSQGISAVILTPGLAKKYPATYALIKQDIGKNVKEEFQTADGEFIVVTPIAPKATSSRGPGE